MRRLLVAVAALALLTGCDSRDKDDSPHVTSPAAAPSAVAPSFDCAEADSDAEKLICSDGELAALDRRLAVAYWQSLSQPSTAKNSLEAEQRGWLSGRDDCWKADDVRRCVLESYQTRLVELRIGSANTPSPDPIEYLCPDNAKPLSAVFYNDFDPRAAVLTWGSDRAIVFAQPSGSGARYGRQGVDFWERQGEVTVDFYGENVVCQTP